MKKFVPSAAGEVVLVDEELPARRPSEVLVQVEAVGLNQSDLIHLSRPEKRWTPGIDVVGTVIEEAADDSGPTKGSRVVGVSARGGGAAEYAALGTGHLTVLPDSLSATDAACLPLAGITALRLYRQAAKFKPERVLITGAGGAVGHFLTEIWARAGAEVTVVAGNGHARLTELGATVALQRVDEVTGTFDTAYDSVGGHSFERALAATAPFGHLYWYGQSSGEPVKIDYFDLIGGPRGVTVRQFLWAAPGYSDAEDLREIVGMVQGRTLRPTVGSVRDWSEISASLAEIRARRIRGKAVVTVGG
ncbi:zinc-binding alcohol dehydrogenase family protein [Streptomyces sp. cg2]|uniref:quinone oxidoreductase family protein n=1 Tax=Streptomyces sp. cg2 TaxID=3238799 RepID=UPI0034E2E72E